MSPCAFFSLVLLGSRFFLLEEEDGEVGCVAEVKMEEVKVKSTSWELWPRRCYAAIVSMNTLVCGLFFYNLAAV